LGGLAISSSTTTFASGNVASLTCTRAGFAADSTSISIGSGFASSGIANTA